VAGVLTPRINSSRFVDGNLFWVGAADDPTKDPRPTNGGYWDSAVAGSITSAGQLRWATVVRATGHDEGFSHFVATPGALYAVGRFGEFIQQDQTLGYGWICRMTTDAGTVVSSMVVGDDGYCSGFNDGILEGNTMSCVGWTRQELNGVYQGWLCRVNIAAALAENPAILPASVRETPGAVVGDREIEPDDYR
jgi:hypothetical protein